MKKTLIVLSCACVATAIFAADAAATDKKETAEANAAENVEMEKSDPPLFWGFGNYGIYSGYQLYGNLVNSEPTLQGYLEGNLNLLVKGWDLGYVGLGLWSNTDLTDKRRDSYGKAFNEWDPNVHYGKTFWFDDENKWGLDYRTTVVWYYYPHRRHRRLYGSTCTTMDWNHYFELKNPFVNPFLNVVHEYHESDANLLEFGLKRACSVTDKFTLTPSATFVWRNSHYVWCFPTAGFTEFAGSGLATMKLMLEGTYMFNDFVGIFAKVAYCQLLDHDLRDIAEDGSGADYSQYKQFVWGGAGITVAF